MPWPAPSVYVDGTMTTAARVSLPSLSSPIPYDKTPYILTEDWEQQITNQTTWTPLALNTAHPEYAGFVLVNESERKPVGVSSVRWTRRYAKVPASYSEPETFPATFPALGGVYVLNAVTGTLPTGRDQQIMTVNSRVAYDFFLVDPATGTASGPIYDTYLHIPVIQAQKYRLTLAGTTWWIDVTAVCGNPPFTTNTVPSRSQYETYIKNAIQFGWDSGRIIFNWFLNNGVPAYSDTSDANPGQLAVEDSQVKQWEGNIFVRKGRWVLAQ